MVVLFVTGAGISANAGIPVYRAKGSSWSNKELEKKSHANRYGNHLDELWDTFWGPVFCTIALSHPTKAHLAIAEFQKKHYSLIATQNIDNLHERAGSENIHHLHGTTNVRCMRCKRTELSVTWKEGNGAPFCPHCGKKKTRPDVVLFGEPLNRKMYKALDLAGARATHVIAVGTSLNVFPATALVMDRISKSIIVNKDSVPLQKWAKEFYNEDADEVLSEILDRVSEEIEAGVEKPYEDPLTEGFPRW